MARLRNVLPLALAALGYAAPQIAWGCHTATICFKWQVDFLDNGVGEDYYSYAGLTPARGARTVLLRPAPEPPIERFLDQEGCMTFETQFAYGHKAMVYSEAFVGDPAVHITASRDRVPGGGVEELEFVWEVDVHGVAANDVVELPIKPHEKDPFPPLMGGVTEAIYRLGQLEVLELLPAGVGLNIEFWDYNANAFGSATGITVGPDSYREKFVMGHEIGHWLQDNMGGLKGASYTYPSKDPLCKFGVVEPVYDLDGMVIDTLAGSHGIRSSEWSTDAFQEGFGHFIASVAFNDLDTDGIFRYYKDIDLALYSAYTDLAAMNYRISLFGGPAGDSPLGGQDAWTRNACPQDWLEDEVSTELDWMRFLWHFVTDEGDAPTLRQVLKWVEAAYANHDTLMTYSNIWLRLEAALLDPNTDMADFSDRFYDVTQSMGVYNEGP